MRLAPPQNWVLFPLHFVVQPSLLGTWLLFSVLPQKPGITTQSLQRGINQGDLHSPPYSVPANLYNLLLHSGVQL